ncbi:plasmid partitioning protein RepB [Jannaschia rubra]|uniref:Chromosome-partitioning protein ParB n=1 Tax=Jannaschia rubra TaxID=282197 RepID=A0A0M6XWI1_9RHOB|nr:plasmid partitioning protein RepB [Jannaschia rubra]CTQ34631.1 Chromosome-partitioning protein ParB [Jannaschia rubra]SFG71518.1 chromosome partitioning protein, ParB family [Jannaschia rubra]
MARKNLLSGLMADTQPPAEGPAPARRTGGAIGAVGKSFAEMRANAVIEIPADMIDMAGLKDRLGTDPEQEALMASLREYGQQVPVLVRHSPNYEGRYDIVYGRRRVAALRRLGMKVRALVRDLPDRALIVAQGQENTARRDLSFIEMANFARQMAAMGFDRKVICDALSIDKTVISRMLTVTDRVPETLIRAIGPAPGVGRDRWVAFARALRDAEAATEAATADTSGDSEARFAAALATTRKPRVPRAKPVTLTIQDAAFAQWLTRNLDELRAQWAAETGNQQGKDEA